MMHSLIPCLSRADIPPGASIRVTVTGIIRSTQQSTQHIVQFSARPFWAPNPVVSRAVQVSAVPPVSNAHKKYVTFILFYGPVSLVSQCGSQANIFHGHIHQQTVFYGHIYFYSPLFIFRVKLDLSYNDHLGKKLSTVFQGIHSYVCKCSSSTFRQVMTIFFQILTHI